MHSAFLRLASLLSQASFHVFRFDYFGTGDSAGEMWEANTAQWKADIRAASCELKDMAGCRELSIVGVRLGAALAAEVATEGLHVKHLVLWDPVVNGKTHIKELEDIRQELRDYMPGPREELLGENYDELLGYPFHSELRTEIEQINLLDMPDFAAERTFLVVSEEKLEYAQLRDQLTAHGVQLQYHVIPDLTHWGHLKAFLEVQLSNKIPHAIQKLLAQKLT